MNKKIATFIYQSNASFKKDTYYRLLQSSSYNWRKLLSLTTLKIIKLLHKVQDANAIKVFIIDDTVEGKTGKYIEGSRDGLWSNKEKRTIRGINIVSLNYSDGYSNFMIDFAVAMGNYARVKLEEFTQELDAKTTAYKRRIEIMDGKSQIAIDMVKRAVKSGIYADYLLVDSWYSKPVFIKEMNDMGLNVISRIANNNKIWNFTGKEKTLNAIYEKSKKITNEKMGKYGKKIQFNYFSVVVEHKNAGDIKIVFARHLAGGFQLPDAGAVAVRVAVIRKCNGDAYPRIIQVDPDQHTCDGAGQGEAFDAVSHRHRDCRAGRLFGVDRRRGGHCRQRRRSRTP